MLPYSKAFISHSSSDKKLVHQVSEQVSAARWEIDAQTFEAGNTSAGEILNALSRSDLFVFLASEKALESPWVISELQLAQSLLYSSKLGGVLVFILDDTPVQRLPEWIRMHVFERTNNPTTISNRIRSKLLQLDSSRKNLQKPFISRIHLRDEIEKRLADLTRVTSAIYVSGIDGIGRRALIANSLKNLFPGSDTTGVEIIVVDGEGLLEIYRKVYMAWHRPSLGDVNDVFSEALTLSEAELIERITKILTEIASAKGFLWMQCDFGTLNEEGYFEPQFLNLLTALTSKRPTLIVRARRFPRFVDQNKLKNVAFFKVESLSEDESRRLWSYALDYHGLIEPDAKLIDLLLEHLSGHPGMIWTAAEYVSILGKAAIEANPRELLETLRAISLSLIDGLQLSSLAEKLLVVFDEFKVLAPSDLLAICQVPDQELAEALGILVSFGLVESDGDHLKLASFFYHSRFRKRYVQQSEEFLNTAQKRLLAITQNYTSEDNVSFATIEAAILAAIKDGVTLPLALDERAILGSHYLRVARSSYDRQRYGDVIRFGKSALAKKDTLSESALVECLRLLAMSAIRTGNLAVLDDSLDRLNKIRSNQAKRHIHFVQGFNARWNGDFETAESEFRSVLTLNPKDVHALRELAQILVIREDYNEAEKFARGAMAQGRSSPFAADILLQCLIEKKKSDINALRDNSEIPELLAHLEVADKRENTSFHPIRQAQYHSALRNNSDALHWLDEAIRINPGQIYAYSQRAQIRISMKHDASALNAASADIKQIENLAKEQTGSKRHLGLLTKLKIRLELAKGNISAAIQHYESVAHRIGPLADKLAKEIAYRVIDEHTKDKSLIAWANKILAS